MADPLARAGLITLGFLVLLIAAGAAAAAAGLPGYELGVVLQSLGALVIGITLFDGIGMAHGTTTTSPRASPVCRTRGPTSRCRRGRSGPAKAYRMGRCSS